jgi:hypothetical protein
LTIAMTMPASTKMTMTACIQIHVGDMTATLAVSRAAAR